MARLTAWMIAASWCWKRFGGPTAQAYQASKPVQDAIAAKIWDGGAGANNWDCFRLLHTGHL